MTISPPIVFVTTLVVSGGISTALMIFVSKRIRGKIRASNSNHGHTTTDPAALDSAITEALNFISTQTPLDEVVTRRNELTALTKQLETENATLRNIEADLVRLHDEVEKHETALANLKKGREDADRMADELRAMTEQRAAENQRFEASLTQSRTQLDVIASEIKLTNEQKEALQDISKCLDSELAQLQSVSQAYNQTSQRFLGLQNQFGELEHEYKKLLDAELSADSTVKGDSNEAP